MKLPRVLSPNTNPALYTALASLALALWQAIQVEAAKGPLTWGQVGRVAAPVVVAALVAWQRGKTTPVADPRDANGNVLRPSGAPLTLTAEDFKLVKAVASWLQGAPPPSVQPPATGTGGTT